MDAQAHRALDVPKNALLHSLKHIPRRAHVQAHLLHRVGDVGPRDRQVLQGADNASVGCGVIDELSLGGRGLGLGVSRSGRGVAVRHSRAIEQLLSVLLLRQEEAGVVPAHVNAEEVPHRTHVLDFERVTEARDDVLEEACRRRGENHVVHVQQKVGSGPVLP